MAGNSPSGLVLGWHVVDPGPVPISRLYDSPPDPGGGRNPATAHARWRAQVEADQDRLRRLHFSRPCWFPIPAPEDSGVVPVYGGVHQAWDRLLAIFATSAALGGGRVRLLNLTQTPLFDDLRRLASGGGFRVRSDVVSRTGSTVDVFAMRTPEDLASLVTDVLRPATAAGNRNEAVRARQELLRVAAMLTGGVDLTRLREAVAIALGHHRLGSAASFTQAEEDALRDYRADIVQQQQPVAERLSDLLSDLDGLLAYARDPAGKPAVSGSGPARIQTYEIGGGGGIQDRVLGGELLARAATLAFSQPFNGPDLLVVAGAEALATEVLDSLTGAAQRAGKRLVLLYGRISDDASRVLGHGGGDCAVFLRLPNHDDAERAARHLGKQFTFVVNGFSLSEGETEQWNESRTRSTSVTTGSTRSSGSSSSIGLKGALTAGRNFGNSVSESLTAGTSEATTAGGSVQRSVARNTTRVHEYVLQPEVFQQLDDQLMIVVRRGTATLAVCDPTIAALPTASPTPWGP
ncbi:hypothetical protein [Amycolatopsis sp. Hca4]|uniref:hypothetical protein n=1 Tax=Amycolatopsis sp. Hca4 TaxID=2742131 RepID=UPI0015923911|nr:hypothetical protein [Amycolatopsis sp. Hca4]QKV75304.1 hypothetical protein HUT10_17140 [Amycolatopsis sp. Hca4]